MHRTKSICTWKMDHIGNCFSLQKEHEMAIKFFIWGHEYVENENYNPANQCYTTALNFDQRHFNTWWELSNIHLKKQNFFETIKYLCKALSINNKRAVLNFYLLKAYCFRRLL